MENDLLDIDLTPAPVTDPEFEDVPEPEDTPAPAEFQEGEATPSPVELPEGEATPSPSELPEGVASVSGGDSLDLSEMLALTEGNEELLQELVAYEELENMTIWEKPLELWTPTEGCLLILVIVVLFAFVYKIVEGVIRW